MATTSQREQPIDWSDVQGLVLYGYAKHPHASNLLLQIDDPAEARRWLLDLLPRITAATDSVDQPRNIYFNIAFCCSGLSKLGLSATVIETFPTAFVEGMASANRSRILGDTGASDPGGWRWGNPHVVVDALLLIFAADPVTLRSVTQGVVAALRGLSLAQPVIETQVSADQTEHFGFHDGISQPVIEGAPTVSRRRSMAGNPVYGESNAVKAGEFLLGYLNEYTVLPDAPLLLAGADPSGILPSMKDPRNAAVPDLGRNGTYLVVRQIAQHVARFWQYLDQVTGDPRRSEALAAKLIGRWKSGAPVVLAPHADDPELKDSNDFVYQVADKDSPMHDPGGFGCPLGAHVRRSNPRDSLGVDRDDALRLTKRHRLIRRGRSYGPRLDDTRDAGDTGERGLMFMCLNANIERQFEFVQQTWINNPSFDGLYDERDPVFGDVSGRPDGTMSIPGVPVRRRLDRLGGFVTILGGGYFFLPSVRALKYLASLA